MFLFLRKSRKMIFGLLNKKRPLERGRFSKRLIRRNTFGILSGGFVSEPDHILPSLIRRNYQ